MSMPSIDLYSRHIREGGAKIAEFLVAHPDVDPHFIEDMTAQQEAALRRHISDLTTTQQIERHELNTHAHNQPNTCNQPARVPLDRRTK